MKAMQLGGADIITGKLPFSINGAKALNKFLKIILVPDSLR